MAAQLKAWDVVVDRLSAEDEFFAKVIASQKAYAKDVMNYLNLNQPDYKLAYKHSLRLSTVACLHRKSGAGRQGRRNLRRAVAGSVSGFCMFWAGIGFANNTITKRQNAVLS